MSEQLTHHPLRVFAKLKDVEEYEDGGPFWFVREHGIDTARFNPGTEYDFLKWESRDDAYTYCRSTELIVVDHPANDPEAVEMIKAAHARQASNK